MSLRVKIYARGHGDATEDERSKFAAWHKELFAKDQEIIKMFTWQNKDGIGFDLQTYSDGEFAGFAHVFPRLGRADDTPVLMGCLGTVMTAKKFQASGVGSTTVEKAGEIIFNNLQADLGVLLCKTELVPFYERLSWCTLSGPVLAEQPAGSIRWPYEAMVLLRGSEKSMPSALDLCGLPF